MDAFDTQILLGPDHVKAIKKVNCMCRIFSSNYLLIENEFKKDNF